MNLGRKGSKSRERIRELEIKLQTILDLSEDGIIIVDDSGIIVEWNKSVEKITGLSGEEALNHYVWDVQASFLPVDQKNNVTPDFYRHAWMKEVFSVDLGKSITGYGEIVSRNGKTEIIEEVITPFEIAGRRYYCSVQHYVTKRKEDMNRLNKADDRFRNLFELCPEAIILVRVSDLVYADVNPAFEKLTGLLKNEVIGNYHLPSAISQDKERQQEFLNSFKIRSETYSFPLRIQTKTGEVIKFQGIISEIRIGHEDFYLAILKKDITDLD